MEKRIFLIGPQGSGRSRLIREALGEKLAEAGGFVTVPEPGPEGFSVGAALRPAASAAGIAGLDSRRFLDFSAWPPAHDNEVFRIFGTRLLQEAALYPFALLDELGGFELLIPPFRAALYALLESGLPLFGALKTPEETEAWRQLYGLGERMTQQAARLLEALAADADTRVIDLEHTSESEALSLLRAWASDL